MDAFPHLKRNFLIRCANLQSATLFSPPAAQFGNTPDAELNELQTIYGAEFRAKASDEGAPRLPQKDVR